MLTAWLLLAVVAEPATAPSPTAEPTAPGRVADLDAGHEYHLGHALIQVGGMLALEIGWYEWQIELNKKDFDFARTWSGQGRRYRDLYGVRFDDNTVNLNIGHAYYNGSFYHDIARASGGSVVDAFLLTFLTSTAWELLIEHREVVSLNDLIVTPIGGLAIGEPFYQLGEFFARGAPSVANRLLTTLLSPARTVNDWVGWSEASRDALTDRFGLPAGVPHRFEVSVLGGATSRARADHRLEPVWALRIDAELRQIDGLGAPGVATRGLAAGALDEVRVAYAGAAPGLRELVTFTKASLWSRYDANVAPDRTGYALIFGIASAFDMSLERTPSFVDFLCLLHAAGPTVDATLYLGDLELRGVLDVYVDFAMPRSYAIDGYAATHDVSGAKSVLTQERYYYAWGVSALPRLELAFRGLRLGVLAQGSWLRSIQGRDRHQDAYTSPTGVYHGAVTDDFVVHDERRELRAVVGYDLPAALRVGLSYTRTMRRGAIRETTVQREDHVLDAGIGGVF